MSEILQSTANIMLVLQKMDTMIVKDRNGSPVVDFFAFITKESDWLRCEILNGNQKDINWKWTFLTVGAAAKQIIELWNAYDFADLLMKKHKLYGAEPLLQWRELGICVRLTNKIARMKNLKANPSADNQGETWNDTLTDIVGYCVLGWWLKERGY